MIYLDIETVPGDLSTIPENIDAKIGNLVDPVKIAAKFAGARQKYVDRAALKWVTGRVICVCVKRDDDQPVASFAAMDEKELLTSVAAHLKPQIPKDGTTRDVTAALTPRFVTFNGRDFDLPFLFGRMWSHGIECPTLVDARFTKPWDTRHHIDLMYWLNDGQIMELWKGANTLDSWCHRAGIPIEDTSGIDGSSIPGLWQSLQDKKIDESKFLSTVQLHCEADVLRLEALYHRVESHFLPPMRERHINYD